MANCPKSSSEQSSTMKVLFKLPPCPLTRREGFSNELFGVPNHSKKYGFPCFKCVSRTFILWRERELVSRSLWASLRSLATMNINAVKLSLNRNSCSWMLTCVACHLSLVSYAARSRESAFLPRLSSFSWFTSAIFWVCLWASLMADIGNRSIQPSVKRFKSSEN